MQRIEYTKEELLRLMDFALSDSPVNHELFLSFPENMRVAALDLFFKETIHSLPWEIQSDTFITKLPFGLELHTDYSYYGFLVTDSSCTKMSVFMYDKSTGYYSLPNNKYLWKSYESYDWDTNNFANLFINIMEYIYDYEL